MIDIVCDTMVWYKLAFDQLDAKDIKSKGYRLLASPTSVVEFASNVNGSTLDNLKKVAVAIVEHADDILPDTERYLAGLWGLEVEPLEIDWRETCRLITRVKSFEQLESGIVDEDSPVLRQFYADRLAAWRKLHYSGFEEDVWQAIDVYSPGYKQARINTDIDHMDKVKRPEFKTVVGSSEFHDAVLIALHKRAWNLMELPESTYVPPTAEEKTRLTTPLSRYIRFYGEFLYESATNLAPRSNDFGDLECFIYADGKKKILTYEKKWFEIIAPRTGFATDLVCF